MLFHFRVGALSPDPSLHFFTANGRGFFFCYSDFPKKKISPYPGARPRATALQTPRDHARLLGTPYTMGSPKGPRHDHPIQDPVNR